LKNIIITGPERSGKTTLSRVINDEFGYLVVVCDSEKIGDEGCRGAPDIVVGIFPL